MTSDRRKSKKPGKPSRTKSKGQRVELPYSEQPDIIITMGNKRLISDSGSLLIGRALQHSGLKDALKGIGKQAMARHGHYECVSSYISLLCQGNTAYEDIRDMQEDPAYYCRALKINSIPSAETLRQRLDYLGPYLHESELMEQTNVRMINNARVDVSATFTGHFPLDIDVSTHDNSKTKKEGVERTYQGYDGYAPIYAYFGREGYLIKVVLRTGSMHSQHPQTLPFLRQAIANARKIATGDILVRMDSGNDSKENINLFIEEGVSFIIKRNLRRESLEDWLFTAQLETEAPSSPREGKEVYVGEELRDIGCGKLVRVIFEVTVRTIDKKGQILLTPDIEANTWWTDLDTPPEDVIKLYHEHALCEQFHSEIKSDIGLERFPSSHFQTNGGILKLAMLAYNILRIIGQTALFSAETQLRRHPVERIRAKTVMQKLVYIAGHVVAHARRLCLDLGRSNPWRSVFLRVYEALG